MERLFTAGQIARMLHLDLRQVKRWMRTGLLEGGTVIVSKWKLIYLVASRQELISFLCENPALWDPRKCPDLPRQLGYRKPPFWFVEAQGVRRQPPAIKVGPGAAWTEDQDLILATMYADGKPLKEIAAAMRRTPKAVKRRKEKLGRRLWEIARQHAQQHRAM